MNLIPFLWTFFMVFNLTKMDEVFLCYQCHQTSKECNNGVNLSKVYCATNKCFVLKYETEMPGVTVLATFRGCLVLSLDEIMATVITEKHAVVKKHFHICNSTLCNRGANNRLNNHIYLIFLVQLFLLIYSFTKK